MVYTRNGLRPARNARRLTLNRAGPQPTWDQSPQARGNRVSARNAGDFTDPARADITRGRRATHVTA